MEKKIDFAIGGQALIEGVMMRSPHFISIAVRKESGEIITKIDEFNPLAKRLHVHKIPVIRGIIGVLEMMAIGMKALDFSVQHYAEEEDKKAAHHAEKPATLIKKIVQGASLVLSLCISLGLGFILFKFVPLYTAEAVRSHFAVVQNNYILFNIIDGLVRIAVFFIYISTLFIFKSFRRVFQYHGAEHMSVHAYEAGKKLTPDEVRQFTPEHPRCGTSFIIAALVVSIFVFSLVPRNPVFWINALIRLSLVLPIAGLSFEFLKWSAKHVKHPLMKLIIAPGIVTQYITTQRPDDKQIEVAIVALQNALDKENDWGKAKAHYNTAR